MDSERLIKNLLREDVEDASKLLGLAINKTQEQLFANLDYEINSTEFIRFLLAGNGRISVSLLVGDMECPDTAAPPFKRPTAKRWKKSVTPWRRRKFPKIRSG